MRFKSQIRVLGIKASKGLLENGTPYDFSKVFVETELDASTGNAKGFSVSEYKMGKSDEFAAYKHLDYPFVADVEFDMVTNGTRSAIHILSLSPVRSAKSATQT